MNNKFLPISMADMEDRGWDEADFVCVTGDAYVDHPSFGIAIVARLLEKMGFRVAMLAQPDYKSDRDFKKFGKPKLGFFVTGGNIDSMVNNYTSSKKKRSDDVYSPGNKAGARPDRAATVYCNKIKSIYPDVPVITGGIESSLRRFAHYDYWEDKVLPSILVDSKADILIFGMGEHQTAQIATALSEGKSLKELRDIRGICYMCEQFELPNDAVTCASFTKVSTEKEAYARACKMQMAEQDHITGKNIVQKQNEQYLVQTKPSAPLTESELDEVFSMPFTRMYHPIYEKMGGIKAIEEVEFSIMHNRGCFGNCNFCAIALHQGRVVTSRSHQSIIDEATDFTKNPRFKGYIHDVGGPTANFRRTSCDKQLKSGMCPNKKCLGFNPCPSIKVDHSDYLNLLRELRQIKGVKKVFVRSGLRFDYMMLDKDDTFMKELIENHVSGQLKVAPEHCSNNVLRYMGKPPVSVFDRFSEKFYKITKELGKEQYLVPYLMSSHPGSTIKDALELAVYLKRHNMRPEQVQDFYPTPGTISTAMFYTGLDPLTMEPVFVPKTTDEKHIQRVLLQYYRPENKRLIINTLLKLKREDLIGTNPGCLVAPDEKYINDRSRIRAAENEKKMQKYTKKPRRGAGRSK
ncbi:MAG: YgiQ family radical SAM protein [Oscillospiraceae bacterium]